MFFEEEGEGAPVGGGRFGGVGGVGPVVALGLDDEGGFGFEQLFFDFLFEAAHDGDDHEEDADAEGDPGHGNEGDHGNEGPLGLEIAQGDEPAEFHGAGLAPDWGGRKGIREKGKVELGWIKGPRAA